MFSDFRAVAGFSEVGSTAKPNLISCEGCGQGIKKFGRKCFCGACSWTNREFFRARYNKAARLRRSVLKMSHN